MSFFNMWCNCSWQIRALAMKTHVKLTYSIGQSKLANCNLVYSETIFLSFNISRLCIYSHKFPEETSRHTAMDLHVDV